MAIPSRSPRLTAQDWVGAALSAIADRGLEAVSVEPLARTLGATKGSFYWHFANRGALVEAALLAWEAGETTEVAEMLAPLPEAATRLRVLMRAALDDRPGARVEAALLASAGVPQVQAVLDRTTRARTGYLRHLFEELGVDSPGQRATTAFALYLGLLHLRRAGSTLAPHGEHLDSYVAHLCSWLIEAILQVSLDAIMTSASDHYSPEQLSAWASRRTAAGHRQMIEQGCSGRWMLHGSTACG